MMTSAIPSLLAASNPLEHVIDHPIWAPGGFWLLSNHMIMLVSAAVIMLVVFPWVTKPYREGKLVLTGTRNFLEAIMVFVRNDVAKPVLGDETDRFMPLLWTLFFFILTCNLLGLLPFDALQNVSFGQFVGSDAGHGPSEAASHGGFHPIYGTATANFYVTATLALIVFVVIQVNGIKANGVKGWLHHFLGGAPVFLAPVMIPVEILGMLIKPFALAVRLAANMTAGHILVAVIIGFVPAAFQVSTAAGWGIGIISVIAGVAIMLLELFVAFLQAYLFTFLSALFISQLIAHHDHDGEHEEEGHELGEPHGLRADDAHKHHHEPKLAQ